MKYVLHTIFLSGLIILGWFRPVQAANPLDVVINEVAWMGTSVSYNDEWIELRNNGEVEINLDGWILKAADGIPKIQLTGNVLVNGFYLLERSRDYTGALENGGEILELYDNLGNLIDKIDASSGWPAGDNATKQTMERGLAVSNTANWQTSAEPGGTPAAPPQPQLKPSPQPELQLGPEPEPQTEEPVDAKHLQSVAYPSGVVTNEILPSPTGPDEEEEWIEIFNQNDFEVNLSNWKITDIAGKTEVYIFPEKTIVGPAEFLVLPRPITKITLNNQGDGLKIIQPDGNTINEMSYENAPRGESYSFFESGWLWTSILTPGSANTFPATAPEPEKKTAENGSPQTLRNNIEMSPIEIELSKSSNGSPIFLAAIFTAFSGGVMILLLKKKIKI